MAIDEGNADVSESADEDVSSGSSGETGDCGGEVSESVDTGSNDVGEGFSEDSSADFSSAIGDVDDGYSEDSSADFSSALGDVDDGYSEDSSADFSSAIGDVDDGYSEDSSADFSSAIADVDNGYSEDSSVDFSSAIGDVEDEFYEDSEDITADTEEAETEDSKDITADTEEAETEDKIEVIDQQDAQKDNDKLDSEELNEGKQDLSGIEKIDGHTYFFDFNGDVYRVDDALMANTTYDLKGYHFTTDELSRISWVEGDLHLRDRDNRLAIKDKMSDIGMGDALETDDRGHVIADLFDGPNGLENLVPQNYSINRGAYNQFESELADEIRNGNDVQANFELSYPEGSFRPDAVIVTYTINGNIYERVFPN